MGTPRNFKVNNAEEAVELVQRLKQNGDYDWFRGQIMNWPLKSSFLRIEQEKRADVLEKLRRFAAWVKHTPGLESIAANRDSIVAVAQHYGLPTNFIDFTTSPEIAGFFSSYGEQTEEEQESCILCLNTEDLIAFWKNLPPEYPPPELITIDVQNLWRLQAQHGTFLYCPYENFEHFYDLDRIFFPFKPSPVFDKDKIFPNRKSHLEILLDQYFMNEQLIEGTKNLPKSIKKLTMPFFPSGEKYDPEVFIGGNPPPRLDSWNPINLQSWISAKHESFFDVTTEIVWEIVLALNKDINSIRKGTSNYIKSLLESNSVARNQLIKWSIISPENHTYIELSTAIQRLWDGLRILPHKDEDIAEGISNCIALQLLGLPERTAQIDWEKPTSACFGETVWIELGSKDGSYSRAYVSKTKLLSAVRQDIEKYLVPRWKQELTGNIIGLLQVIWAPDKLFEFERLAKLFAQEIAPVQVLMRSSESAIFFSPARLDSFGLP